MLNLGINFTAWPEMLAWPYLILKGWLPYRDIAIAHNPLLLLDLVVFFKIFGVGILQLKIFTWLSIGLNIYLTYFVSKKFWGKKTAFLSAISYLLLTICYEGNGLWFDLALTPFALLLYLFIRQKKYVYTGLVFALGFLTKQTFIYFLFPVAYYILHTTYYKKSIFKFLIGSSAVIAIFIVTMHLLGVLDDFYFWAIRFGVFYLPHANGQVLLPTLKQFVFSFAPIAVSFFNPSLLPWIIVGLAGAYPRFELFHFQPALPFITFALASFVVNYKNNLIKYAVLSFGILYLAFGIYRQIGGATRFYEPEVIKVTEDIKKLGINEIYVVNYWDNIYALTNTLPATKPLIPYIPWYLGYQNSRDSILVDLKTKMPEAIVVNDRSNLGFNELETFVDRFYSCNLVGGTVELCIKNK